MSKYYLYRHIRLDKNEPFYIGIGTKKNSQYHSEIYSRAYAKTNRNKFWCNVTNKTHYLIEIVLELDDYELIKEKEKEFIKLYGRRDINSGSLVNLTNGGEGAGLSQQRKEQIRIWASGRKLSQITRIRMSKSAKDKIWSEESKEKLAYNKCPLEKRQAALKLFLVGHSIRSISRNLNIGENTTRDIIKSNNYVANKYKISRSDGERYFSCEEAAIKNMLSIWKITQSINKGISYNGYTWNKINEPVKSNL